MNLDLKEQPTESQGEKATSIRMTAICEVRCVIDLSGPQSLFGISICHHLSSQDTHRRQPLLSHSLCYLLLTQTIVSIHILIHPSPRRPTLNKGRQACSCGSLEFQSSLACAITIDVCVGDLCNLLETSSVINTDLVRTSSPHGD